MSSILAQYCCCDPTELGACCVGNTCVENITQDLCFEIGGNPWGIGIPCNDLDCGFTTSGCNTTSVSLCESVCASTYVVSATWNGECIWNDPGPDDPPDVPFSGSAVAVMHLHPSFNHCDWGTHDVFNLPDCAPAANVVCSGAGFGTPNEWVGHVGLKQPQQGNNSICLCPEPYNTGVCAGFTAFNQSSGYQFCPPAGQWIPGDTETGCTEKTFALG